MNPTINSVSQKPLDHKLNLAINSFSKDINVISLSQGYKLNWQALESITN